MNFNLGNLVCFETFAKLTKLLTLHSNTSWMSHYVALVSPGLASGDPRLMLGSLWQVSLGQSWTASKVPSFH